MNCKKAFRLASNCNFNDAPELKIGHIRADNDNYRWWTTYFPSDAENFKTQTVTNEVNHLAKVIFRLLPKYSDMVRFCRSHPETKLRNSNDEYDFFIEGRAANYWVRCITRFRDYNMYINIYRKKQD